MRTLYFGKAGLLWDCQEAIYDEAEDFGYLPSPQQGPTQKRAFDIVIQDNNNNVPSKEETEALRWHWCELIQQFGKTALTHESDRLAAIAGIATLIRRRMGGQYFSGLWEKSIVSDLL
jgi:hypothetical protein